MAFINNPISKTSSRKTKCISCIILSISILCIVYGYIYFSPSFYSTSSRSTKHNLVNLRHNRNKAKLVWRADPLLLNLTFYTNKFYHLNGIAYDYHSQNEIGKSEVGSQWKVWPLPNKTVHTSIDHIKISPFRKSKVPFVDAIYIISLPHLIDRQINIKKAFRQQGISTKIIKWQMKWNYTTCNSNSSRSYVYKRLNLNDKPLNGFLQKRCSLTMNHVDIWYDIAERRVPLALILEDDAIFVPFFKEKLARMVNAAITKNALRLNGPCVKPKEEPISKDEWIHQNPMFVVGRCALGRSRNISVFPSPSLSTHKMQASRCAHAYMLTFCSAQAMIDQIHAQKNDMLPADAWQDYLFRLGSVLQAFWSEPPLVYQGNRAIDLNNLTTYKITTHEIKN